MPRTTIDPKTRVVRAKVSPSEAERLRKCAEALKVSMSTVLRRGLALVEAEIAKGQAPDKK